MKVMFVHASAEARVVLKKSYFEYVQVSGDNRQRIPKWGKTLKFSPFKNGPLEINNSQWLGHCFVEDPEIYALMRNHPSYGYRFLAIDPETGQEVEQDKVFIVGNDERGYKCTVCLDDKNQPQEIANAQGCAGHLMAKKHSKNVENYMYQIQDELMAQRFWE